MRREEELEMRNAAAYGKCFPESCLDIVAVLQSTFNERIC